MVSFQDTSKKWRLNVFHFIAIKPCFLTFYCWTIFRSNLFPYFCSIYNQSQLLLFVSFLLVLLSWISIVVRTLLPNIPGLNHRNFFLSFIFCTNFKSKPLNTKSPTISHSHPNTPIRQSSECDNYTNLKDQFLL